MVVAAVADGQTYVVAAAEDFLAVAVLYQDVAFQQFQRQLVRGETLFHPAEEVVGLTGEDFEIRHLAQFGEEQLAFFSKLLTASDIFFVVLFVNLHVELAEGVDVPNRHLFFESGNDFGVARSEDAQPQARDAVALADAFHHHPWSSYLYNINDFISIH